MDARHLRYRCGVLVHAWGDALELADDDRQRGDLCSHRRYSHHENLLWLIPRRRLCFIEAVTPGQVASVIDPSVSKTTARTWVSDE